MLRLSLIMGVAALVTATTPNRATQRKYNELCDAAVPLAQRGLHAEAAEKFAEAHALVPNDWRSVMMLAGTLHDLPGEEAGARAIAAYRRAEALRPAGVYGANARENLAGALFNAGRAAEAVVSFHRVLEAEEADTAAPPDVRAAGVAKAALSLYRAMEEAHAQARDDEGERSHDDDGRSRPRRCRPRFQSELVFACKAVFAGRFFPTWWRW